MWMTYTCTHLPNPETTVESRERKLENSTPIAVLAPLYSHCILRPMHPQGWAGRCKYKPSPYCPAFAAVLVYSHSELNFPIFVLGSLLLFQGWADECKCKSSTYCPILAEVRACTQRDNQVT